MKNKYTLLEFFSYAQLCIVDNRFFFLAGNITVDRDEQDVWLLTTNSSGDTESIHFSFDEIANADWNDNEVFITDDLGKVRTVTLATIECFRGAPAQVGVPQ